MIYTWTKGPEKSVEVPKESSSLVQYDLIGQTVSSETIKSITGEIACTYSLSIHLHIGVDLFIHVRVCICLCRHMLGIWVCTCDQSKGVSPQGPSTLFFELSPPWSFLKKLETQFHERHDPPVSASPILRLQAWVTSSCFFMWPQLTSLCF